MHSPTLREPPGVLGAIAARSLADVRRRAASSPTPPPRSAPAGSSRSLAAALAAPGLRLIAEFKPRAPSAGDLCDRDHVEAWVASAGPHAAALSVLCDEPYFGGGFDLLARARAVFDGPILCKDFIVDERQLLEARNAGADAVLLIVALLPPDTLRHMRSRAREIGLEALVEVHDDAELREAVDEGAPIIGVNSRDLRTLATDPDASERLLRAIPGGHLRVAESGLRTRGDIERVRPLCDGVLIGTALSRAADPASAVAALGLAREVEA